MRKKYITEAQSFFKELSEISQIKVYPSISKFCFIELLDGSTSADFVSKMLIKYGVYTRTGSDKIGLSGELAELQEEINEENRIIINSIKDMFKNV